MGKPNLYKVLKAFSSERIHLPKRPLNESRWVGIVLVLFNSFSANLTNHSLPFPLASDVSVEDYNSFIENQESNIYKFEYKNGSVYIVEMSSTEHEAVVAVLGKSFRARCPPATYAYNEPIQVFGTPLHHSPAGDGTRIAPDLAVYPNQAYILAPPVPHPGPPPSDIRGNPHARIICEVAISQSSSNLKDKCKRWRRQSYVQSVLGIKIYDICDSRNNPQGARDRPMKAILWRQGIQKQTWRFGTVNKDGSPTDTTGCNGPNDPNYIIAIPVSDAFYDPAIPAIGYATLPPPPPALMNAIFRIDLYEIQQMFPMDMKVNNISIPSIEEISKIKNQIGDVFHYQTYLSINTSSSFNSVMDFIGNNTYIRGGVQLQYTSKAFFNDTTIYGGTLKLSTPTKLPWIEKDIIILTNGLCQSTYATITQRLAEINVPTNSVGGFPNT
ncbi:22865_t:CDS:2 [Cetraspora pellucida]|uniref:22865_t:CDS:1 n=1 Tax=Cetraspora pellucida TaxID=1433469 RepID=A0A9N9J4F3_9GLOM|nr:22865_t:CDS:2 [Cetraspora pellucida]